MSIITELIWKGEWYEGKAEAFGFKYDYTEDELGVLASIEWADGGNENTDVNSLCSIEEARDWCQGHHLAIVRLLGSPIPCLNCGGTGYHLEKVSEEGVESVQCLFCNASGNTYIIPTSSDE